MNLPSLPLLSGFALTAISSAGLNHWWDVRQWIATSDSVLTQPAVGEPALRCAPGPNPLSSPASALLTRQVNSAPLPAPAPDQQKFYEALITKMNGLQSQNRDLLDQLAETNRDIMKLEFRVDTHSESFRPMPVSEDRPFTSLNSESIDADVLPPKAKLITPPDLE